MDSLSPGQPGHQHHLQAPLDTAKLRAQSLAVLQSNDLGHSTRPAPHLYPHQWLWDSCFTAIGLRHIDVNRAKTEIFSLFRGQWENGMIPHEIFAPDTTYHAGRKTWRTDHLPGTPQGVYTTGITQSPMIAEAVIRIGEKLSRQDRHDFYQQIYPGLVKYHEWLYRERDPYGSGLVTLIHSHESGLDNTPYWMKFSKAASAVPVRALHGIHQDKILDYLRKDRKAAENPTERLSSLDMHAMYHIISRLRRQNYDLSSLLAPSYRNLHIPLLQDVAFNAILIRANTLLQTIAGELGATLPQELLVSMEKAPHAFETLFADGDYWSRNFRTGELIREPTIATFLALYTGTIPQAHADALAQELQQPNFWPHYGIASTPTDSPYFKPHRYWQGPVWINTNWLIADGLERYGYDDVATKLRQQSVRLVAEKGVYEYYSPLDGSHAGAYNHSWTAALTIDMLARAGMLPPPTVAETIETEFGSTATRKETHVSGSHVTR